MINAPMPCASRCYPATRTRRIANSQPPYVSMAPVGSSNHQAKKRRTYAENAAVALASLLLRWPWAHGCPKNPPGARQACPRSRRSATLALDQRSTNRGWSDGALLFGARVSARLSDRGTSALSVPRPDQGRQRLDVRVYSLLSVCYPAVRGHDGVLQMSEATSENTPRR